jgi:hypothetical protein
MRPERRRKRSSYTGLSLQYWLSSMAREERLFALVLADAAGLLVASSLAGPEAEELAAVAPLLARPTDAGLVEGERGEIPVSIRRMHFERCSLYLCAVGDRQRSRRCLRLAEGGVRRILAEPPPARALATA